MEIAKHSRLRPLRRQPHESSVHSINRFWNDAPSRMKRAGAACRGMRRQRRTRVRLEDVARVLDLVEERSPYGITHKCPTVITFCDNLSNCLNVDTLSSNRGHSP